MDPINPTWLINPVRLINLRCVNHTNQILLTTVIKAAMKKRYIKLVFRKLIYIQKGSIQPWSKKVRRFNIQMKDLTRWTQISLMLRLYVKNMEPFFLPNLDSTNI